ncbi:hypothetical protein [Geotalea uraniireducens]|uniref:hypothetical protein n=1 Tax=Geotalea uraniireducens TaxID=351604 RepID=UPI0018DD63DD|nr:hypothetical protein [Geotalea uraniireducens]
MYADEVLAAQMLQPGVRFGQDHQGPVPGHDRHGVVGIVDAQPVAAEGAVRGNRLDPFLDGGGTLLGRI